MFDVAWAPTPSATDSSLATGNILLSSANTSQVSAYGMMYDEQSRHLL